MSFRQPRVSPRQTMTVELHCVLALREHLCHDPALILTKLAFHLVPLENSYCTNFVCIFTCQRLEPFFSLNFLISYFVVMVKTTRNKLTGT